MWGFFPRQNYFLTKLLFSSCLAGIPPQHPALAIGVVSSYAVLHKYLDKYWDKMPWLPEGSWKKCSPKSALCRPRSVVYNGLKSYHRQAVEILLIECATFSATHPTFDHVYLDIRVNQSFQPMTMEDNKEGLGICTCRSFLWYMDVSLAVWLCTLVVSVRTS